MSAKSQRFPSLRKQLEDAKAPAGSPLEQLIRDNQDFSVLAKDESDPLELPPWLKVHWQKSHPEIDYSGGKVAYPLILERVHEWMVEHPDFPVAGEPARGAEG